MTWWTTATLTDGLVYEVASVVCFVAALAAVVVAAGLLVHTYREVEWGAPVGGITPFLGAVVIAVMCWAAGQISWPPGHPVGVAFVAVVALLAVIPVAVGCAAIVALCNRLAADDQMAMHGTAADQLDEFIESVRQGKHRTSETSQRD